MTKLLQLCLYSLAFFAVFNFTSSLMGGGYIVSDLGGSPEIAMYGVCFFGLGNALLFALGGELGRRFGRLQVLLFSLKQYPLYQVLRSFRKAEKGTSFS